MAHEKYKIIPPTKFLTCPSNEYGALTAGMPSQREIDPAIFKPRFVTILTLKDAMAWQRRGSSR